MNAEIITIGTELMFGETIDTHSSFISQECRQLGITVQYHTSTDDQSDRLYSLFQAGSDRSDLIVICGGLGPTLDDITKEVLADYLGIELVFDPQIAKQLEQHFQGRQLISSNNYKQAYVFPQAKVFPNHHGTAPGLAITMDETTYILLPGPPKELIPMFKKYIRPFLLRLSPDKQTIIYTDLSFFGIGESILEDRVKDLIEHADNPTLATYLFESGVLLRITGRGDQEIYVHQRINELKKEILNRVGEYCYSEQKEMLEKVVVDRLTQQNQTLACAENCTGGLLTYLLSIVPASDTVLQGGWISTAIDDNIDANTTQLMAERIRYAKQTDYALSVTGMIKQPLLAKNVAETIYVGLAEKGEPTRVYQLVLRGSRQRIQQSAARHALFILQQRLKKGEATS